MKLSIIIPVFNEEKTVAETLKRVRDVKLLDVIKEIIVIDDGSTDKTASEISKLKSKISNFKFLQHKNNLGKGSAVISGIKNATGDYILIQDADLEYHPKFIKDLLIPIKTGNAIVVYGTRVNRLPHFDQEEKTIQFLSHYLGNRGLSLLTSILYGQWITDMETGYKLFPKKIVQNIKLNAKGFEFEPEITAKLAKLGHRIHEVQIKTVPRHYSEGKKINTLRDGVKALWYLVKYRFTD